MAKKGSKKKGMPMKGGKCMVALLVLATGLAVSGCAKQQGAGSAGLAGFTFKGDGDLAAGTAGAFLTDTETGHQYLGAKIAFDLKGLISKLFGKAVDLLPDAVKPMPQGT